MSRRFTADPGPGRQLIGLSNECVREWCVCVASGQALPCLGGPGICACPIGLHQKPARNPQAAQKRRHRKVNSGPKVAVTTSIGVSSLTSRREHSQPCPPPRAGTTPRAWPEQPGTGMSWPPGLWGCRGETGRGRRSLRCMVARDAVVASMSSPGGMPRPDRADTLSPQGALVHAWHWTSHQGSQANAFKQPLPRSGQREHTGDKLCSWLPRLLASPQLPPHTSPSLRSGLSVLFTCWACL